MTENSPERRNHALKLTAIATLLESSRDPSLAHLYPVDEWIQYAAELALYRHLGVKLASRIQCILVESSLIDDDEFMQQFEQKSKEVLGEL